MAISRARPSQLEPGDGSALRAVASVLLVLSVPMAAAAQAAKPSPRPEHLGFTPNVGQHPAGVDFGAATHGMALSLSRDGITFVVPATSMPSARRQGVPAANATFSVRPRGGSLELRGVAVDPLPGVNHYYLGNDPSAWRTSVPRYRRVVFRDAYPGIDLVVYGKNGWADYDFVVGPGARAEDIELDFGGAQSVELKSSGDVWLTSDGCHFRHLKPVIYQARERKRDIVDGGYVGRGTDGVGFEIGGHDSTRPLVIHITVDYRIRVVSPPRTGATVGPERVRTEP